jgi:hypothetical protein
MRTAAIARSTQAGWLPDWTLSRSGSSQGASRRGSLAGSLAESQAVASPSEEESAWERFGLAGKQNGSPLFRRFLNGMFFVSAWLAMPLAVLTCHGWLGLLVHGMALSGAAGLLQKATIQTRMGLQRLHSLEGEAACASVRERS